jgi:hypothetical protein
VTAVDQRVAFGALPAGVVIGTSYLQRQHGTGQHRNARKFRKAEPFSNDWEVPAARTAFTPSSANFSGRSVRSGAARLPGAGSRAPAMVAGLTDQVCSGQEWLTLPAGRRR